MTRLKQAFASTDRWLDRCHYRSIAVILAIAVMAWLESMLAAGNGATIVESAFMLDALLAAVGLGVLLHLLTRKGDGAEGECK